jgi:SUKH-4 immunity protein
MAKEQTADWPRFTLVTYAAPTGIPHGWDAELLEKGAPDGLVCTAARELILFEHPDAGPLVCFGTMGPDDYVCLDPHTKQVVGILYGAFRTGDPQPEFVGPAWVVNSSLDHFIASIRAMTQRFPFDSEVTGAGRRGEEDEEARDDRLFNEWEQAVLELGETLDRIDPANSILGGQFWGDVLADVGMGNYKSERWINPPDY